MESTAPRAPAALALGKAYRPHVILLDVSMPFMDGYAVAERLRLDPELKGLAIAAVTGWSGSERDSRARAAGFDCQLVKPVDLSTLKEWLDSIEAPYD